MSLTLKVTIPIDSLEKLRRMSPLDGSGWCPFEKDDDHKTAVDVCEAVVTAMQEFPYDITPKKVDGKEESGSWGIDDSQVSRDGRDKCSQGNEDCDGTDGESEGYDEIDAEEFDRQSTSVSFHGKGMKDTWAYWGATKDTKTEGCTKDADAVKDSETGDSEKYSEAGETETDAAARDDRADTEIDDEEGTESDSLSRNDDQMHITVDVDHDGSRSSMNFRISMGANDTWDDLACNLRRMTDLFNHQMTFYFQNSFYDQRCQESLSRAGVMTDSVIYARPLTARLPIAWPGTCTYFSVAQDGVSGVRQAPPMYDICMQTAAHERSGM